MNHSSWHCIIMIWDPIWFAGVPLQRAGSQIRLKTRFLTQKGSRLVLYSSSTSYHLAG